MCDSLVVSMYSRFKVLWLFQYSHGSWLKVWLFGCLFVTLVLFSFKVVSINPWFKVIDLVLRLYMYLYQTEVWCSVKMLVYMQLFVYTRVKLSENNCLDCAQLLPFFNWFLKAINLIQLKYFRSIVFLINLLEYVSYSWYMYGCWHSEFNIIYWIGFYLFDRNVFSHWKKRKLLP